MSLDSEDQLEGKAPGPFRKTRVLERYFGAKFLVLVLLLGIVCFLVMILIQWINLNQKDVILPASLLARSTADYSGTQPAGQVQDIGLAIIGDKMRDAGLQPGDLRLRLASVTAELLSPVPTATPLNSLNTIPSSTSTPTLEISPYPAFTATKTPLFIEATQAFSASNTPAISETASLLTTTAPTALYTVTPIPYSTAPIPPGPLPTYTPDATPIPTAYNPTHISPTQQPYPPHPTKKPHHPKPTKKPH